MHLFLIIALLVIVSALYSYINARWLKLPGTIGIMTLAILGSVVTIVVDKLDPNSAKYLTILATNINFSTMVLNIMLGFLLFASAFNLNTRRLKKEMRPVFLLSTLGVILSTIVFGSLLYWVTGLLDIKIPYIYCLLFGALISPTDPVAVSAIVTGSKLPNSLETIISGESLFNDGIGLVLFISLLEITQSGTDSIDFSKAIVLFIQEVFGGIALGAITGFLAHRLMKSINDFQTIVLVSLALVMTNSLIATYLHLSIPLSVVTAGLFAGGRSINVDNNDHSHQALEKFWTLIDEMLNTMLFVMIGLQMINFPFLQHYWLSGAIGIIVILVARWSSIMLPLTFLRRTLNVNYGSINILTWAGLRGGISIALALSLPASNYRHFILAGTYFIVIFSIIVQGLTLNKVINATYKSHAKD
ncbi:sodium:proton antiporter [Mucilaginibacter sp. AK015]|uniref:cation:proton antiporter n=1 Tax=Mucilaginibacter sp. AK015 TaxID=2723072 RepID=UPI00160C69CC|nr:sodium:proton antiporter [Mucilaginibacter sp. AK015]MBB5394342.1 CPA1 family monovalent cation:H+ antiporter [Mucilaginibacter sp. AK015]